MARDHSLNAGLVKTGGAWRLGSCPPTSSARRTACKARSTTRSWTRSCSCGRPASRSPRRWASGTQEQADYAISEWAHFFRGEPRVKNDTEVTAADIAAHNIVLFGDPSSNAIYKRIAGRLPIAGAPTAWSSAAQKFPPTHAPVFIFPNPLNPKKYVVINSGFTFHDQSNNDMQSPKLPDWAVVDITKPGNNYRYLPLFVESQGFFDEAWKLKGPRRAPVR